MMIQHLKLAVITAACFLLFTLECEAQYARSADFSQAFQARMLKRTVRLSVLLPRATSSGSGVVVKTERNGFYVVTAPHVIDGGLEIEIETFTNGTPRPTQTYKNVRPLVADQTSEFALLYVQGKFPLSPIPLCPDRKFPRDGEKVLSIGCDGGDPPTCHVNLLVGHNQVHWATSEHAAKGRSGGPLITQDGYVIGACCCTNGKMTFYSYSGRTNKLLANTGYDDLLGAGRPMLAQAGSPVKKLPHCPRCQNPNGNYALPVVGQRVAIPGIDLDDFFDKNFDFDFDLDLGDDFPFGNNFKLQRGNSTTTTIIITNNGLFLIEE